MVELKPLPPLPPIGPPPDSQQRVRRDIAGWGVAGGGCWDSERDTCVMRAAPQQKAPFCSTNKCNSVLCHNLVSSSMYAHMSLLEVAHCSNSRVACCNTAMGDLPVVM